MRPRSRQPRHLPIALVVATACFAVLSSASLGASGGTIVTADVVSATTLDTSGCLPGVANRTSFGVLQPGTGAVTGLDCDVVFGSTNDSSTLRAFQPDGRGTAMAAPPTSATSAGTWDNRALDVDLATASIGWVAAEGSSTSTRLFKTTDGGASWTGVADADITASMRSVDAVSTSVAWAGANFSSLILRTTDGSNWAPTTTPAGLNSIYDIAAADASTAWVAGSEIVSGQSQPRLWRTTDGGANWTLVFSLAVDGAVATDVVALSATDAWVATNGQLYHATDGVTFTASGVNLGTLERVAALDANRVAAVTGTGQVYVTTNGGSTWNLRSSIERGLLGGLAWSPNGDLWATGQLGAIQRSSDYGVTWTAVANTHEGTTFNRAASAANGQLVVTAAARTVIATSDGGTTWSVWRQTPTTSNRRSVDGIDSSRLWTVGGSGTITTSTDGGTTWTAQTSPTTNALYEVVALDKQTAVAVGAEGTIVRTANGGTTWSTVASGTGARLRAVNATSDGDALLAAGDGGTMLVSTNRGVSWTSVATGTTDPITAVALWDSTRWIFGTGTILVRTTTDAGSSWTTRATTGALETIADAVAMPGTDVAYLVWDDNVSRTADGGATWTSSEMPGGGQVYDIDAVSVGTDDIVWAAGHYGRLLRGESNGTAWTTVTAPTSASSYQGVVALGPDSAVLAGDSNHMAYTTQSSTIADYSGTQWGSSSAMFGVCLRSAAGAVNTWPTTGSCPMADGTYWRALPLHAGIAAAKVADLASAGSTTARFRFGMFVPAAQAPGTYRAPIAFEVVAPSA